MFLQPDKRQKNLLKCEAGTSLIVVAFALGMLMVLIGVVVDVGRMYAVQAKAQNAADAALLGAVATRDSNGVDNEAATVQAEMVNMFNANYPANYLGSTISDIAVVQSSPGVYQATFTVTLPAFMPASILNDGPQTYSILSQVTAGLNTEADKALEITLVLDNTGSMGNSLSGGSEDKIDALKEAANDLTTILFGDATTLNNLHMSVVPYNIVVQIGTGHDSWIQSYSTAGNPQYPAPTTGSETNNTNSLPKYQAGTSGTLTGGVAKGFAGNRATDFFCGPYETHYAGNTCQGFVSQHIVNTCSNFVPVHVVNTCAGFVSVCSCDAETGKCSLPGSSGCSTCTPQNYWTTCTPQNYWTTCTPTASYYLNNNYTCYNNGLDDTAENPPTDGVQYQFRLPFENNITVATENPALTTPGTVDDHTWTSTLAPLLFASNVQADVHTAINAMHAGGDTRINVGLSWGWFTLSPKWQGLWDSSKPNFPGSYDPNVSKVVVLMTDGVNDLGSGDDTKTKVICNAIKNASPDPNNPITIYTIGLGSAGQLNQTLLQNCATNATYYFNAPTTDQLKTVFHQIGDTVSSDLSERLSQ